MQKNKPVRICKLTLKEGQFVKSHIIPLSLTRLLGTGKKFVETGIGLGIKKRSNSWYDDKIVIREGEEILSDIDSKAIRELRSHRLVWSGWGPEAHLQSTDIHSGNGKPLCRRIKLTEPKVLQLFF